MWMVIRSGALVLSMTLGGVALAQEAGQSAVVGVIQNQLEAFQRDDFDEAFTFASPLIKNMFRNPSNFGAMVKQGYPMVWRPADVTFADSETQGSAVLQKVIITDAGGAIHVLEYEMIPVGDGWQINGVRFLEAPEVGV